LTGPTLNKQTNDKQHPSKTRRKREREADLCERGRGREGGREGESTSTDRKIDQKKEQQAAPAAQKIMTCARGRNEERETGGKKGCLYY
jgi:hypothetical protein